MYGEDMAGDEDRRRLLVVVDDVDSARVALRWSMQHVVRGGDIVTLLHVLPPPQDTWVDGSTFLEEARRLLRLKGFQLALSFKELCDQYLEVRVEIVVMEGDEGPTIVSLAKKLRASTLILGQHKHGFLWRMLGRKDIPAYCIKYSGCQVLAVKQKKSGKGTIGNERMSSEVRIISEDSIRPWKCVRISCTGSSIIAL